MMLRILRLGLMGLCSLIASAVSLQGAEQAAATTASNKAPIDPCDRQIPNVVAQLKHTLGLISAKLNGVSTANLKEAEATERAALYDDIQDWSDYVCEMIPSDALQPGFLAEAELTRQDKQPGATSNASGTTSLVSKGSSPWLLGFALEHGGLTQTTNGNTITFRGNVANSIRAILKDSYLASFQLGEKDPLVQELAKLSFGLSFDTSANQPSTSQGFVPSKNNFSGFSAKYELINHRDPREARYRNRFAAMVKDQGYQIAHAMLRMDDLVRHNPHFRDWTSTVYASLQNVPLDASDEDLQKLVKDARDQFVKLFADDPDIRQAAVEAATRVKDYNLAKSQIYADIRKTPLLTIEYNYVRQLTTNDQSVTATAPNQRLPSLSNINLVWEKGFQGVNAPEFTLNASVTLFNSTSSVPPKYGTVRDYRTSAQLDVPLREIANLGKPVLSFSGQFLGLLEEPLGQKVMLNGVTIDRRGNIGVFQTKITIPIKDSGVKIPISFTYASRTELIKEADRRGNIGITFDLDTLFSKAK